VQSFIAQARKTQDLYAGSKFLSDLMKFAHEFISENDPNAEIIFPQLPSKEDKNHEKVSATHRILAIIENTNICKNLEDKIKEEFINIAKQIKTINDNFSLCKPQLNDLLQIYWVAKEMENDNFNYKEIERLLGAVKNVRAFNQFAEKGRKCSLCGERNVKFYRKNDKEKGSDKNSIFAIRLFIPMFLKSTGLWTCKPVIDSMTMLSSLMLHFSFKNLFIRFAALNDIAVSVVSK